MNEDIRKYYWESIVIIIKFYPNLESFVVDREMENWDNSLL